MKKIEVNGKVYEVAIASTEEEKEKGLQDRAELPEGTGMLFIYDEPDEVSFWMKDTLISLDIIFIDEYGDVISVAQGKPNDETPITEQNVKCVLEVNAGSEIKAGDEVDLSEIEEYTEDEEEEEEDEASGKMAVLNEDGSTQMELDGGERIFSRIHTKKLISLAKKATKSKKEADYKTLGKKVFAYIDKQNTQKQEYTSLDK